MNIRDYVKNTFKANTNVKGWSGWSQLKDNAQIVKNFAQDLKAPNGTTAVQAQTFESAMKSYGLTENDIKRLTRNHFLTAVICVAFSLAAFLWMFHLIYKGLFLSSLVSLSLSALMAAYGFREHFFYFQLKQRKLNCTVKEWASSFVKR